MSEGKDKNKEERKLVEGLLSGDKRALRRFYGEYYPKLKAYLQSRVKTSEDAEEIAADVLISALEAVPTFSFRSSLWTFLVAIAKHEVADYYRKLYAKKALKLVPFVDQVYSEPLYSSAETVKLFYVALAKISPVEKKIILWKYEEGLSVKEIAENLGVGVKAAESKLYRARQAFTGAYMEIEGKE